MLDINCDEEEARATARLVVVPDDVTTAVPGHAVPGSREFLGIVALCMAMAAMSMDHPYSC